MTTARSSRNQRAAPARGRRRPAILVVDNDSSIRELLTAVLEHYFSAGVTAVASNRQAFRAAQRQKFDLVISDYGRPGGDGLVFLGEFKRLHPKIPVILLSGQAPAIRQRARRLGANACLDKAMMIKPRTLGTIGRHLPPETRAAHDATVRP